MQGINHLKEIEEKEEEEIEKIEKYLKEEDDKIELDFSKLNDEKMNDDD